MFKIMKHLFAALALALGFVTTSVAQQSSNTASAPSDNYVTEKNFKSKIFDVKYRDPNSLAVALSKLGSGFKGATISPSTEFKTLTVRDFPENLATIEEALKRLDVPSAQRPNIELHMHVLLASNTAASGSEVPAELRDVLPELRNTLNYKNYELAASVVQRLAETSGVLEGSGVAEVLSGNPGAPNLSLPYVYDIRGVSFAQNASGENSVQIADFVFSARLAEPDRARVQTALNLHDGEKVVVGTAAMRSRALVVVLIAKLIK
ncbi:MAG TPA: secretin N-terminal domain-containing protein [Terriglobales bacterium]|nr:secretin N-terminal domain-containing protein [Terriglobales bacterium]